MTSVRSRAHGPSPRGALLGSRHQLARGPLEHCSLDELTRPQPILRVADMAPWRVLRNGPRPARRRARPSPSAKATDATARGVPAAGAIDPARGSVPALGT